ncbi:hypothetical protein GCM10009761_03800 [Agromyces terreus]
MRAEHASPFAFQDARERADDRAANARPPANAQMLGDGSSGRTIGISPVSVATLRR